MRLQAVVISVVLSSSGCARPELETRGATELLEVGPMPAPRCQLGAPTPDGTPVVFPAQIMQGIIPLLEAWIGQKACAPGDPNVKNQRDVICNFSVPLPAGAGRAVGFTVWGDSQMHVGIKGTLKVYDGDKLLDSVERIDGPADPNGSSDLNFFNCEYTCSNADAADPNLGTSLLSAAPFHSAVIKGNGGNDYLPPDGTGAMFCGEVKKQIVVAGLDCEIGPGAQIWKQVYKSSTTPKWVDTKKASQSETVCFPRETGFCPWFRDWTDKHPNVKVTRAVIISDGTTWERDRNAMTKVCKDAYDATPAATRDTICQNSPEKPGAGGKDALYAIQVSGRFVCTKAANPNGGGGQPGGGAQMDATGGLEP
jgi:hypothetical protein